MLARKGGARYHHAIMATMGGYWWADGSCSWRTVLSTRWCSTHRDTSSALGLPPVTKDPSISASLRTFCAARKLLLLVSCCQAARRPAGWRGSCSERTVLWTRWAGRHHEHTSALASTCLPKDARVSPSFQCFCVVRKLLQLVSSQRRACLGRPVD